MSLNEHERRALRAIEEALSVEEPALAALLSEYSAAKNARRVRRMAWWVAALAVLLVLVGLVLADPGLWLSGLLLLVVVPLLCWTAGATTSDG